MSGQACPTLKNIQGTGAVQNQIIYYNLDSNLSSLPGGTGAGAGETPANQVLDAITTWNSANQTNGTGVTFLPSNASNPSAITFSAGESSGTATSQTLVDPGMISPNANPVQVNFYTSNTSAYSSTAQGYSTMFLQTALHEIGHIMGLGDVVIPQNAGYSTMEALAADVMNPTVGLNDIDLQNRVTAPTSCDNAAAKAAVLANQTIQSATSSGGSGGDGTSDSPPPGNAPLQGADGGGGCIEVDEWDDYTNTVTSYTECS